MVEAFQKGEDIHAATAAKVFGVALENVTREQRLMPRRNFGIVYGVSAFGLSQQTNLNRSEAKELIDAYYLTYPKLKAYMNEQVDFARENGFVETVLGRRRYLKDINSQNLFIGAAERNAVMHPFKECNDIIKSWLRFIVMKAKIGKVKCSYKFMTNFFDVPVEVDALTKM